MTCLQRLIKTFHVYLKATNKTKDQQHFERLPDWSTDEVWTEFTTWGTLITTVLMRGLHDNKHGKNTKSHHDCRILVKAKLLEWSLFCTLKKLTSCLAGLSQNSQDLSVSKYGSPSVSHDNNDWPRPGLLNVGPWTCDSNVTMLLACVASVSVGFGSKELLREKWSD